MVRRSYSPHPLHLGLTPIRSPHLHYPYDHARPRPRRAQVSRSLHPSPSPNNPMCLRCDCLPPLPCLVQTPGSYKRNHSQPGATSSVILVALVRLIRRPEYRSPSHPRYRNHVPRSTFYLRRAAHVSLYKGHFPSADGP